jgi:hypothetical protein
MKNPNHILKTFLSLFSFLLVFNIFSSTANAKECGYYMSEETQNVTFQCPDPEDTDIVEASDEVQADLTITAISVNTNGYIYFTMANNGKASISTSITGTTEYYVDTVSKGKYSWSSTDKVFLQAGKSTTITTTTKLDSNTHAVKVNIDSTLLVTESNETNNILEKQLKGPSLISYFFDVINSIIFKNIVVTDYAAKILGYGTEWNVDGWLMHQQSAFNGGSSCGSDGICSTSLYCSGGKKGTNKTLACGNIQYNVKTADDMYLYGDAWDEQCGWVEFDRNDSLQYGVKVNLSKKVLEGYAWSDTCGYLDFNKIKLTTSISIDTDQDTITDDKDNCKTIVNTDQADLDKDKIGDVCDDDKDGDTISNSIDNCPIIANKDQKDTDGDKIGDLCDDDVDGDYISNTDEGQTKDTDSDGTPDYMDSDSDNDYISDKDEAGDSNIASLAKDTDSDGIPDYIDQDSDNDNLKDNFEAGDPNIATLAKDTDSDGISDYKDQDSDNDTISDSYEGSLNSDSDSTPDYLDSDSDNDGYSDKDEAGDNDIKTLAADYNKDGIPDFRDPTNHKQLEDGVSDAITAIYTSRNVNISGSISGGNSNNAITTGSSSAELISNLNKNINKFIQSGEKNITINGESILIENKDIEIYDINGKTSYIANGGNITIKKDIINAEILLIARKNSAGKYGNIYIDPNVQYLKTVTLVAEGGVYRSSHPAPNQTLIEGSIISNDNSLSSEDYNTFTEDKKNKDLRSLSDFGCTVNEIFDPENPSDIFTENCAKNDDDTYQLSGSQINRTTYISDDEEYYYPLFIFYKAPSSALFEE